MSCFKILICVVLLCGASAFAFSPAGNDASQKGRELSLLDKFALYTVAKSSPNRFQNLSVSVDEYLQEQLLLMKPPSVFTEFLHLLYFDLLPPLALLRNVSPGAPLPELDYYYFLSFALLNLDINIDSGKTTFKGQENIRGEWDVSPTSFEFKLKVPSFKWSSPGFSLNISDRDDRTHHLTRDFHLDILNGELALSANYGMVEDVGLVISNFSISTSLEFMETTLESSDVFDFSGNLLESYGPLKSDLVELLEFIYGENGEDEEATERRWEIIINCVLTNHRHNPDECDEQMFDDWTLKLGRFYTIGILQPAILAAMTRP